MESHKISRRSVLLISLFVIAFSVAIVVDLAALLESLESVEGVLADDLGNRGRYFCGNHRPIPCDGHVHFCRRQQLRRRDTAQLSAARSLTMQRALTAAITCSRLRRVAPVVRVLRHPREFDADSPHTIRWCYALACLGSMPHLTPM